MIFIWFDISNYKCDRPLPKRLGLDELGEETMAKFAWLRAKTCLNKSKNLLNRWR